MSMPEATQPLAQVRANDQITIHVRTRSGADVAVSGASGDWLMQPLRDNNLDVDAACGGCVSCGTCHVYVENGLERLPPISDEEAALISGLSNERSNSRLSCQIRLDASLDGMHVTVAPADG